MPVQLASLCYLENGEDVLMLHRNKRKDDIHYGKWNGVGGKFEAGESPEECAKREICEETGITDCSLALRGFITFPIFDGKKDWYAFVFRGTANTRDICSPPEGDLKWVPKGELLNRSLWEGDKLFLDWLFGQDKFFSAKIVYSDGELKEHEVSFYIPCPDILSG